MNQFSIGIPNPGIGTYRLITKLLHTINCLAFGALFLAGSSSRLYTITALTGTLINIVAVSLRLLGRSTLGSFKLATGLIFLANAVLWIIYGKFLIALLMGLVAVAGVYANRSLQIDFNEEGIKYPSFPARFFPWLDVEQVICKDGMLSIDLKNNKLLQFNIERATADNLNEVEFNAFCRNLCNR